MVFLCRGPEEATDCRHNLCPTWPQRFVSRALCRWPPDGKLDKKAEPRNDALDAAGQLFPEVLARNLSMEGLIGGRGP